jgi:hypothetical protein
MRGIFRARSSRGRAVTLLATVATVLAAGGGAYAATASSGQANNGRASGSTHGPFMSTKTAFVAGAAVVNSNGTLARGLGVVSTTQIHTGAYQVLFTHKVNRCGYEATLGSTSTGVGPDAQIGVASRAGHKNGVWINTYSSSGSLTNEPFHLIVVC